MVSISNDAAGLIRQLVSDSELPAGAGLRPGTDDDPQALAIGLAREPREESRQRR